MAFIPFEASYRAYIKLNFYNPMLIFLILLYLFRCFKEKKIHCLVLYVCLLQMNTHKCALHNITPNPLLGFSFHMPSDYSHHLHVPSLITLVMKPNSTNILCQSHLLLSAYKWPHSGFDSTQDMCIASSSGHESSTWLQSSLVHSILFHSHSCGVPRHLYNILQC